MMGTVARTSRRRRIATVAGLAMAGLMMLTASGAAQAADRLWSVAVHLLYVDGTEYDIVIARGLTQKEVSQRLADCGAGHGWNRGTIVFHCYPIPE